MKGNCNEVLIAIKSQPTDTRTTSRGALDRSFRNFHILFNLQSFSTDVAFCSATEGFRPILPDPVPPHPRAVPPSWPVGPRHSQMTAASTSDPIEENVSLPPAARRHVPNR